MEECKVLAVIVTYNRLDLLRECLDAVQNSECGSACLETLVVDNASTDGTDIYVQQYQTDHSGVFYARLQRNIGGAGGFCEGIRYGLQGEYDYFWLMDDDTIVRKESLDKLLRAADLLKGEFGYLASQALWTDGNPSMMNEVRLLEKNWSQYHDKIAAGLFPIQRATFVSLLLNVNAVKRVGLPIKEFFIWSDDQEYTDRIAKEYTNYYVADSLVVHKMLKNIGSDIATDDESRLMRYRYAFRNEYYIASRSGQKAKRQYYWRVLCAMRHILKKAENKRLMRMRIIIQGVLQGWRFHPGIEKWDNIS